MLALSLSDAVRELAVVEHVTNQPANRWVHAILDGQHHHRLGSVPLRRPHQRLEQAAFQALSCHAGLRQASRVEILVEQWRQLSLVAHDDGAAGSHQGYKHLWSCRPTRLVDDSDIELRLAELTPADDQTCCSY